MLLRSRVVTDPSGTRWRVSVRWMPWQRRLRGEAFDGMPDPTGFDGADVEGCAPFVLILLLIVLMPVLLGLGEVVLLFLVALPLSIVAAIVGLRRWTVEVQFEDGRLHPGLVRGTHVSVTSHRGVRRTQQELDNVAARIAGGEFDPAKPGPRPE